VFADDSDHPTGLKMDKCTNLPPDSPPLLKLKEFLDNQVLLLFPLLSDMRTFFWPSDSAGRHGADSAGRHGADSAGRHGADSAGRHGADSAGRQQRRVSTPVL